MNALILVLFLQLKIKELQTVTVATDNNNLLSIYITWAVYFTCIIKHISASLQGREIRTLLQMGKIT